VTSDQIKHTDLAPSGNIEFVHIQNWLQEIAYQLAVMNERRLKVQSFRGNLGSPVNTDSETEMRGDETQTYQDRIVRARTHHADNRVPEGLIRVSLEVSNQEYKRLLTIPLDPVHQGSESEMRGDGSHGSDALGRADNHAFERNDMPMLSGSAYRELYDAALEYVDFHRSYPGVTCASKRLQAAVGACTDTKPRDLVSDPSGQSDPSPRTSDSQPGSQDPPIPENPILPGGNEP